MRVEWRYRLLSCPGYAEAAAAVEHLGAALAVKQLIQPTAATAAAAIIRRGAATKKGRCSSSRNNSSGQGPHTVYCSRL